MLTFINALDTNFHEGFLDHIDRIEQSASSINLSSASNTDRQKLNQAFKALSTDSAKKLKSLLE